MLFFLFVLRYTNFVMIFPHFSFIPHYFYIAFDFFLIVSNSTMLICQKDPVQYVVEKQSPGERFVLIIDIGSICNFADNITLFECFNNLEEAKSSIRNQC